jgi:hypothetical protein
MLAICRHANHHLGILIVLPLVEFVFAITDEHLSEPFKKPTTVMLRKRSTC